MKHYSRSLAALLASATLVPFAFSQASNPKPSTPSSTPPPATQPSEKTNPANPMHPTSPTTTTSPTTQRDATMPHTSPNPATTTAPRSTVPGATDARNSDARTSAQSLGTTFGGPEVASRIRSATAANRDDIHTDIQSRMDSSRLAITELQTRATGGQGEAQSDAARAVADLRQREMELRSDLAAYRSASADRLDAARDRLATSYEAYAKAIANAETSMKSPQSASPTMPRQN